MYPRVLSPLTKIRLALSLLLAVLATPARAADEALASVQPQASLADYHHSRWTVDDGAPPAISAMAQTSDGWLWLGTLDGLYRFDGLRFFRYPLPPGLGLNRNLIRSLHAGPHGELYIGRTAEGIAVLSPDGRLQDLPRGPADGRGIDGVAVDTDGSIWIVGKGIHRLRQGRWQTVEDAGSWSVPDMRSFVLDRQGQLWASRNGGVWRLNRHTGHFEQVLAQGGDLLQAPDGSLWLVADDGAVRKMADAGPGPSPAAARAPGSLTSAQFANDGALWSLGCPQAPCVLPGATRRGAAYRLVQPAGAAKEAVQLSGKNLETILADREGDIWISTENGLDRFRRKRVLPTELGGAGIAYSLAADAGGRVWAANAATGRMWQLLPDGAAEVQPLHPVSVLARDPAGTLLLGGRRSIWREGPGGLRDIPLPPGPGGKAIDRRMLGILDDGKVLWTATMETGLLAWENGAWHRPDEFKLPSNKIYQSALAGPGRMWLATGDGKLFHYDVATKSSQPPIDIRALGMTAAIFPGAELLLSGDNGSGVVRDGKLAMLRAAEPNVLRNVSGLVVGADGGRWLNGAAGLVRVSAADWQRSIADPALPLRYEVFDSLDGYPGRAVFENRWRSAWSGDGRHLWLAATGGVVRVDMANLERNRVVPVPVILSLSNDKAALRIDAPSPAPIRLDAGTRSIRVDFTAPSLRMPERLRFEYRLEGVDADWQDAGTRRTTSYTSVKPGDYVFRLRAINEDGVRSAADAVLPLHVEPTVLQTLWFKLLAAAALALLLVLSYCYRVRYLTRRVAERMQVTMAERERIARTLHDTFLQTVQSLMLRVDAIAAGLPREDTARRELEEVLGHAASAMGEGREQLLALRSSGGDQLEGPLNEAVAQLRAAHAAVSIGLRVAGRRRPVIPEAGCEIVAIAREALHNACIHAAASQVRALLEYGDDCLVLSVSDDGRGFDPAVLRKGAADGRWGLVGMRERAQRIGATLEIIQGSEGGAVVRLSVPAAGAYRA